MKKFYYCFLAAMFHFHCAAALTAADPFAPEATDFAVWGPACPNDALMPSPDDIAEIREWERAAFAREAISYTPRERVTLEVVRQDFNRLRYNEACLGNRLKIGSVEYDRGLGTHADSRIIARFPKPVTTFSAQVGIDNNSDTGGRRGSAVFAVEAGGKEIYRSKTITGADAAERIDLTFEPTDTLTLITETTDDGPTCDQCDWCDAAASGNDASFSLSDGHTPLLSAARYPFSFVYGGKSSDELLPAWNFEKKELDALHALYAWTDPKTGLMVEAHVRRFEKFAAIETLLTFKNGGKTDTPPLTEVYAARVDFALGQKGKPVVVHTIQGDSCSESTWRPLEFSLKNGEEKTFAPVGGRPSNLVMPFWNLTREASGDREISEGVFAAVGWTGQWGARFKKNGEHHSAFVAGQSDLAAVLRPNESIRQPRVLLMPWHGERINSHVIWRRLLMFEYTPRWNAAPDEKSRVKPQSLEIFGECFGRYYRKRPGWEKFNAQVEFAHRLADAGCTSYWFDAAWFPLGFPNGVGNWHADPENFPGGIEALGKAVHELGLKFLLWFEPERVAPNTEIAKNHPEYVFGGERGGLYKLSDTAAEKYLTELLLQRIGEYGVDIYRNDFNIDPLSYWRGADEPNRKGMTEVRYIEALYRMWDTLLKHFPKLWIDNCASGGRRIDLEMISRSIVLWQSDTCCQPDRPEWDQIHTLSLAQYIPLFSAVSWDSTPYTFRSAASPGAILQYNFLDDDYDSEQAKRSIAEAKVYQKFWYGDFYPLSVSCPGKTSIIAWQLHRSDLEAGIVYLFRQSDSPYLGRNLDLKALDVDASYAVRFKSGYDVDESKTLTGRELTDYPFILPKKRSAVVIEYQKIQ